MFGHSSKPRNERRTEGDNQNVVIDLRRSSHKQQATRYTDAPQVAAREVMQRQPPAYPPAKAGRSFGGWFARAAATTVLATSMLFGGVAGAKLGADAAMSGSLEQIPIAGTVYQELDQRIHIDPNLPMVQIDRQAAQSVTQDIVDNIFEGGAAEIDRLAAQGISPDVQVQIRDLTSGGITAAGTSLKADLAQNEADLIQNGQVRVGALGQRIKTTVDQRIAGLPLPPPAMDALEDVLHRGIDGAVTRTQAALDAGGQAINTDAVVDTLVADAQNATGAALTSAFDTANAQLGNLDGDQLLQGTRDRAEDVAQETVDQGITAFENAANQQIDKLEQSTERFIENEVEPRVEGGLIGGLLGLTSGTILGKMLSRLFTGRRRREA